MRVWHVAAMPFPTEQGTQAAVAAMVRAEVRAGRTTGLVCYASGRGGTLDPALDLERAPAIPGRPSFRSGPSWRKLAEDAALGVALRRALARRPAEVVIAHHVEAAAVALALPRRPAVVFVAHTSLGAELPFYGASRSGLVRRAAGLAVDAALIAGAEASLAVSPALVGSLPGRTRHVPIPWPACPPREPGAREAARGRLGLAREAEVVLYAGNLDAYQGWEDVLEAIARLAPARPRLQWLVATASEPGPLRRRVWQAGVPARLQVVPLDGEATRRELAAAADVAVVPRRAPGGVPVKLLDAMARGLPVVAPPRALAGLPWEPLVWITARDDDPAALADALTRALEAPADAARLAARARDILAAEASDDAYLAALDAACEAALSRRS